MHLFASMFKIDSLTHSIVVRVSSTLCPNHNQDLSFDRMMAEARNNAQREIQGDNARVGHCPGCGQHNVKTGNNNHMRCWACNVRNLLTLLWLLFNGRCAAVCAVFCQKVWSEQFSLSSFTRQRCWVLGDTQGFKLMS